MKKIFLIPPSEGKTLGGVVWKELLSFDFPKPLDIALSASEKDLKCTGTRYEEWMMLNRSVASNNVAVLPAIERYSGVMYKAIDYVGLDKNSQHYFDEHVYILSGMYGLLKPQDLVANYKLPIETRWLVAFWKAQITKTIQKIDPDQIVNLLPLSYQKMIDRTVIDAEVITPDLSHDEDGNKLSHGIKKLRWVWLHETCKIFSANAL